MGKKREDDISMELISISFELLKGPESFMEPAIRMIATYISSQGTVIETNYVHCSEISTKKG